MVKKSEQPDGIYEAPEPAIDSADDVDDEVDLIDVVLTKHAVSVSEFKKNPNAVVALMHKRGIGSMAVMTNNKATFYVVTPERLDDLLEKEWQLDITPELLATIADIEAHPENLIPVSWEDLRDGKEVGILDGGAAGLEQVGSVHTAADRAASGAPGAVPSSS